MSTESVVFNRYRLDEQIGAGGAGVVWKATDERLHQAVALKRISLAALDGEQAQLTRDRALREARLAAQLRGHPHVVTVYDVLVDEGDIWLVMEYVPARSLREILRAHGPLDAGRVARIGAHIADALAAGHTRGIEHRDVKPGNILIGDDGTVKLTDYGISHLTGDPHLTQTGISGTPAYLAPEVAGQGKSSPASDVFSLGSTLYTAVEGQPPFGTDDNTFRLLSVVRTGIIRPPTCAGALEPLLLRLLQVTPSTRPDAATTRDLLAQLAARLTDTAEPLRPPLAPSTRATRRWWPPRRRAMIAAAALIAVPAVAAGAVGLSMSSTNPDDEQPPADAGRPPAAIGPAIQKQRNADPCSLIDLAALRPYGDPQITPPPFLESCEVTITHSSGTKTYLQLIFYPPGGSSNLEGVRRTVGDVTIVRNDRQSVQGREGCLDWLVLPGRPRMTITAFPYRDEPVDLCRITDVATNVAIQKFRQDGIVYKPDRTSDYSLASRDACDLLDATTISTVPELNPTIPDPGFANWSCTWGTRETGSRVKLRFELRQQESFGGLGERITIADKEAYLQRYSSDGDRKGCNVYVVHRPAANTAGVNEVFFVSVEAPSLAQDEQCPLAIDLAEAVEEQLSEH